MQYVECIFRSIHAKGDWLSCPAFLMQKLLKLYSQVLSNRQMLIPNSLIQGFWPFVKGVVFPCLHVLRCGQPAAALEVPHNWLHTVVVVGGGVAV